MGSKGIQKKNIKTLAGKPLCEWVIKAAFQSDKIGKIYVSTESEEIKKENGGAELKMPFFQMQCALRRSLSSKPGPPPLLPLTAI